jgi:diguanylate cyclase (GGDEF)-like protein
MGTRNAIASVVGTVGYAIFAWFLADGVLKTVVWVSIPLGLGAFTAVGAHRNGLSGSAWRFIAAGLGLFGFAELVLTAEENGWYEAPTLAPSYFAYLTANFAMLIGLVQLVKRAAPQFTRIEWVDCAIVAAVPACLLWQFIISPLAPAGEISAFDRGFLVGILVFDFAFALMAWRLLAGRYHLVSGVLILSSTLLMAAGDIAYDLSALHGGSIGGATDVVYPISWLLTALAALHPSSRTLTSFQTPTNPGQGSRRQFWSLAAVASVAPIAALAHEITRPEGSPIALSLGALLVILLVLYRVRILVDALENAGVELRIAATHDGLTGLANRTMLMDRLEHALSKRHGVNNRCALVYADLNGFKATNDTYGHSVGDQLLVLAASRLRETCRSGETVARLGGDEFTVLVENTNGTDIDVLVDRVRNALRITDVAGLPVNISASVGVAVEPIESCSAAELLQRADQSMYREKSSAQTTQAQQLATV